MSKKEKNGNKTLHYQPLKLKATNQLFSTSLFCILFKQSKGSGIICT